VADEGSGPPVVLTDVRLGAHEGSTGSSSNSPGRNLLGITLANVLLPPGAPPGVQPWEQQDRLAIRDAQVVRALITDSLFEGRHAFYAGVTDRLPFAVARFEGPQRIVIDVPTERAGGLGETCHGPAGFTVGYPSDWAVSSGETVPACSPFVPSDVDLPEATDVRVAATAFSIEPVVFDRVTRQRPGGLARAQVTVDGRDGVRIERETQHGL
jgi:hypothetical protein